tara:strand:+ start:100 stop:603 length:504 start_codon:yes stop_codon:yes gene_type:complete
MINLNKYKIISHRGLINGPSLDLENNPQNISSNIKEYPFLINEIDVNLTKNGIFLGHDKLNYQVNLDFIIEKKEFLILHLKKFDITSQEVLSTFEKLITNCHMFAHEEDPFVITNRGWIWSHPKKGIISNTILVMPEKIIPIENLNLREELKVLKGVCTDYPLKMID